MKHSLQQTGSLRQELKINPRLYQAMDLLYMPLLDLQQHLKQELLNNPFLEMVEPDDDEEAEADNPVEPGSEMEVPAGDQPEVPEAKESATGDDGMNWEEVLQEGFDDEGPREERDQREYFEPVSVERRDLGDHLDEQIQLLELTPRQARIIAEIAGNINDDGYLALPLEEIVEALNEEVRKAAEAAGRSIEGLPMVTLPEAEQMLETVQGLDPAGVGARSLRECLLLQLKDQGRQGTMTWRMVDECFEELIAHRWGEISRKLGLQSQEVQAAADEVAKLDPKPGLRYSGASDNYIIPDLVVEKIDGRYHIFLNDTNLPRLKLSRSYQEIARDKKKFDAEHKEFIASRLNSANWMIQAIEQRRQTMLKVMHYIVERQRDFFERGVQYLKPLTLREVAEVIGMHESTVSRVTNEKFVQTPRGVLPLKFFFSSGLATTGGDDVSARGIKDQIAKMVENEDPKRPLTDQAIVNILKKSGVVIARRTVAKYRDQLGVLSARMRKRV
ncbi:MAG: RNA polymerase factor sigma-54 [Gemmatimonadetes bacterium]|nr:RNA polymerase factor sigma-54 [Gemmatimonadota bacterium]